MPCLVFGGGAEPADGLLSIAGEIFKPRKFWQSVSVAEKPGIHSPVKISLAFVNVFAVICTQPTCRIWPRECEFVWNLDVLKCASTGTFVKMHPAALCINPDPQQSETQKYPTYLFYAA